jgi:hypothetical protein
MNPWLVAGRPGFIKPFDHEKLGGSETAHTQAKAAKAKSFELRKAVAKVLQNSCRL